MIDDLSKALGISIGELLTGEYRENENLAGNIKKTQFYVCPVCGNVIAAVGAGSFSCCGISLPRLEAEESDTDHVLEIETIENEFCITLNHPMEKKSLYFIYCLCHIGSCRVCEIVSGTGHIREVQKEGTWAYLRIL